MNCGAFDPFRVFCGEGDDEVEVEVELRVGGGSRLGIALTHTGTSLEFDGDSKNQNGCAAILFSGDDETFDEGKLTDADAGKFGARTLTFDEDQTTTCNEESSSAYMSGAWTFEEDNTTIASKPHKSIVAPAQSFIYEELGVEPESPVETQDESEKKVATCTVHEIPPAETADESPSDQPPGDEMFDKIPSDHAPVGLIRTYKGDALSGMDIAFVRKDAAGEDDDEGTADTSPLDVTQDSSASEDGSSNGIEVKAEDVGIALEEDHFEISSNNDNSKSESNSTVKFYDASQKQPHAAAADDTNVQGEHSVAEKKAAASKWQSKWNKSVAKSNDLLVRSPKTSLASF